MLFFTWLGFSSFTDFRKLPTTRDERYPWDFSPTNISKGREDYKDLSVFIGLALGVIAAVAVVIFLLLGALIKAEMFGDDRFF